MDLLISRGKREIILVHPKAENGVEKRKFIVNGYCQHVNSFRVAWSSSTANFSDWWRLNIEIDTGFLELEWNSGDYLKFQVSPEKAQKLKKHIIFGR